MARAATAITVAATGQRVKPISWSRTAGGYPPAPLINENTGNPFLEANSQEFKAGDMVYLNAGAVTQILYNGTGPLAGFALTNATNVTSANAEIEIMPVNTVDEYEMTIGNITTTRAVAATTYIGLSFGLVQITATQLDGSTTYCTCVDISNTTQTRVKIVGLVKTPDSLATSTTVRVRVKFLPNIVPAAGTTAYPNVQF